MTIQVKTTPSKGNKTNEDIFRSLELELPAPQFLNPFHHTVHLVPNIKFRTRVDALLTIRNCFYFEFEKVDCGIQLYDFSDSNLKKRKWWLRLLKPSGTTTSGGEII